MLLQGIKNLKKRDLRLFGLLMGVLLMFVGGVLLWKGGEDYWIFLIGVIFILCGYYIPKVLGPILMVLRLLGIVLIKSYFWIIFLIWFYGFFTLLSLISRTLGIKFLDLKVDKARASYWRYRGKDKEYNFDRRRYERQY